jgi:flagellar hook assembly protein FlgD
VGSGQVISVTIVDARGRFIKNLVPRALLSTNGYFLWNGTQETGKPCEAGEYIFIVEQYDLKGQTKTIRLPVTITYGFKKV